MTKITQEDLKIAVRRLKQMRFFPSDAGMEGELMIELASMCHDAERLHWLSRRAIRIFPDWCGVGELRALYSSRWKPADSVRIYSSIYIATEGSDGYPTGDTEGERISRQICPPRQVLQIEAPQLPDGALSADPEMDRLPRRVNHPLSAPRPEDYDNPANEALYRLERGTGAEENEADRYRQEIMARIPQRKDPAPWPEGVKPITKADVQAVQEQNRKERP